MWWLARSEFTWLATCGCAHAQPIYVQAGLLTQFAMRITALRDAFMEIASELHPHCEIVCMRCDPSPCVKVTFLLGYCVTVSVLVHVEVSLVSRMLAVFQYILRTTQSSVRVCVHACGRS